MDSKTLKKISKKYQNEDGQSTIEFLVTFAFSFLFIFSFLKVSINYTKGYLAHLATFSASRSYLVYDNHSTSTGPAENAARDVFKGLWLDKISSDQFGPSQVDSSLRFNSVSDMDSSGGSLPNVIFKGAYFDYEESFAVSNALGGTDAVTLRSESFLGREPTRRGCLVQICAALQKLSGQSCSGSEFLTFSDNGC